MTLNNVQKKGIIIKFGPIVGITQETGVKAIWSVVRAIKTRLYDG